MGWKGIGHQIHPQMCIFGHLILKSWLQPPICKALHHVFYGVPRWRRCPVGRVGWWPGLSGFSFCISPLEPRPVQPAPHCFLLRLLSRSPSRIAGPQLDKIKLIECPKEYINKWLKFDWIIFIPVMQTIRLIILIIMIIFNHKIHHKKVQLKFQNILYM